MAPIISGLDLIWRNNIDIIALTTDELQDKEKSVLINCLLYTSDAADD